MGKLITIVDPFPRSLELIFSKDKFKILKSKYELLYAPKNKKNFFYEKNIHKASFIIGQPDLPKNLFGDRMKQPFATIAPDRPPRLSEPSADDARWWE